MARRCSPRLRGSSIGQKALAIAAVYQVALEFTDNGAPGGKIAGYAPSHNRCYLKRTMDPGQLAAYFVHEMLHAQRFKQGKSPVAGGEPGPHGVCERMVEEETTATALSFEARFEADPAGALGSGPLADAYAQYKRVRNDWRARHLTENPGDTSGAETLSKAKGRAIVRWQVRGNPGDDGSTRLPMLGPEEHRQLLDLLPRRVEQGPRTGRQGEATGGREADRGRSTGRPRCGRDLDRHRPDRRRTTPAKRRPARRRDRHCVP